MKLKFPSVVDESCGLRPTILIADDDEAIASILGRALRRKGYDVALVADGKAALELLDHRPGGFDLLLLDVLMPCVDSMTVLRHVRQMSSRIGCIMMTAWTNRWPQNELIEAGPTLS